MPTPTRATISVTLPKWSRSHLRVPVLPRYARASDDLDHFADVSKMILDTMPAAETGQLALSTTASKFRYRLYSPCSVSPILTLAIRRN